MNIQTLGLGKAAAVSSLRNRISNAYERLAGSDDYKKNENNLRVIQIAVVTVSAASTGFVNALAHRKRIGDALAFVLAILVIAFVEKFYFTLRHGLTTTYKSGKQRLVAWVCYRAIQATMILNSALLCAYIVGFTVPDWLELWNRYSLVVHFALALVGVQAVRDSDAVTENRILELKAETGREDLVTARKAAAIGSPVALLAAKTRGFFDAIALSFRLLFSGGGFSKKYIEQLKQVEAEKYGGIDALPYAQPTQVLGGQRNRPGFVSGEDTGPKAPARWI